MYLIDFIQIIILFLVLYVSQKQNINFKYK